MGGTFKSPKGVGLSSDIGISEENKSVSNSYSQNYDDDEFETISKSHMSQSRGNSVVGGFHKQNTGGAGANDSKTDGSYSLNFEDSSTVNVNVKQSQRSKKSDDNTGKGGRKSIDSKNRKKIEIDTRATKPIKEVAHENSLEEAGGSDYSMGTSVADSGETEKLGKFSNAQHAIKTSNDMA